MFRPSMIPPRSFAIRDDEKLSRGPKYLIYFHVPPLCTNYIGSMRKLLARHRGHSRESKVNSRQSSPRGDGRRTRGRINSRQRGYANRPPARNSGGDCSINRRNKLVLDNITRENASARRNGRARGEGDEGQEGASPESVPGMGLDRRERPRAKEPSGRSSRSTLCHWRALRATLSVS